MFLLAHQQRVKEDCFSSLSLGQTVTREMYQTNSHCTSLPLQPPPKKKTTNNENLMLVYCKEVQGFSDNLKTLYMKVENNYDCLALSIHNLPTEIKVHIPV